MLSEHSIAQSPRAQYGTIRVKAVRLLPKMSKFSARRVDDGSGPHDPEFPHHIHGRVLFPVLEAERQRGGALQLRAILGFGFGFWIRIGLYWITDAFAIHLLSFAIICCHLPSGGGHLLFFTRILRCSSHFEKQKYGSPTPRRAGSRPGLSRNPWELYNQNGTNQQMVYGTLKHDFSP